MVHPRKSCKLEFTDNFLLPFLDQSQSDVVVFAIIYFHIYIHILIERKHGISTNDIILFIEKLKFFNRNYRADKH